MYQRRIRTLVLIAFAALSVPTVGATTAGVRDTAFAPRVQEPIRVAQGRKKMRKARTTPRKFDKPVSRSQPIHVRLIEANKVEYIGKYWPSQSHKEQMKESTIKRIRKGVRDELLHEGFVSHVYEETAPKNPGKNEEPILLEIQLEELRYGSRQHLTSISVKIHNLNDSTFTYGTFTDAGQVRPLCRRIAARFARSTD